MGVGWGVGDPDKLYSRQGPSLTLEVTSSGLGDQSSLLQVATYRISFSTTPISSPPPIISAVKFVLNLNEI